MSTQIQEHNLSQALQKFENIMQYRSDMYHRLAQRVRTVVRGGMIIMSMVALALFFLLYTLATQMQHAATTTRDIQANVARVAENMNKMNALVAHLEQRMILMENIQQNMAGITDSTGNMTGNISELNREMQSIQQRMTNINGSLQRMSHNVNNIGYSVGRVGRDMGKSSKAMSPFNMMPFP